MNLRRYLVRRVLLMVPTFLGITALTFAIAHFAPGDPLHLDSDLAAAVSTPELDAKPLVIVQYGRWLSNLARFDFGRSLVDHRQVSEKLVDALPKTLLLASLALLLAWALAVPSGVYLATARGARRGASILSAGLALASALPSFWVAVLLLLAFANPRALDWFPYQGLSSRWHVVLPVLCLTYPMLALAARQVRAAMQASLAQQYVTAARARGISERRVVWHHAFRNALLPLITVLGLQLPHLISGSVVVERVFGIAGMGSLAIDSVVSRDYPVVMAIATLTALVTMFAMFLVDLAALMVDPRLRGSEAVQ